MTQQIEAYILLVPDKRKDILLDFAEEGGTPGEPVPNFSHKQGSVLVILAAFEPGKITHIAKGKKGRPGSGGTGQIRLNLVELRELSAPVSFDRLLADISSRLKGGLMARIDEGGLLPPATSNAVINILADENPSLLDFIGQASERIRTFVGGLTKEEIEGLSVQRESVLTALALAGQAPDEVLEWEPPPAGGRPGNFLDGLLSVRVREDPMVILDYGRLPGFNAIKEWPFSAKEFVSASDPSNRLTVFMANRQGLEAETGADLIYYNEKHKSFIMVQYKAMNEEGGGPWFRWGSNRQFEIEVKRMSNLWHRIKGGQDQSVQGFRLHENPFLLKICRRIVLNLDDAGLFPGMYIPLDLWSRLVLDPRTLGERGGRRIGFDNARYLSRSQFVDLIVGGWLGTNVPQTAILEELIKEILEAGRTVAFAVKLDPASAAAST